MTALMVLMMLVPCVVLIGLVVLYIRMEKADFDRLQHSFTEAIASSNGAAPETPAPVSERIDPLPPEYDDEDADTAEDSSDDEDLEDLDENLEEEDEELPWD